MNEYNDRKKSMLTFKGIVIQTRVTIELILNYQTHPVTVAEATMLKWTILTSW